MTTLTRAAATCHPDRPVLSVGLCRACYHKQWRRAQPRGPLPASSRRAIADPFIPRLPGRPGGASYTFTDWPDTCPKCHSAWPLERDGREAHCPGHVGGCGWTGYLVAADPDALGA